MARTATKMANILSNLYEETFSNDSYEPFRITWADLRGIAGVAKLTSRYLNEIDQELNETGYTLIRFDNFLVVTQENNMSQIRLVPPRVIEEFLYDEEDELEFDDEDEDDLEDPNEGMNYDDDEDIIAVKQ